MIGLFAAGASLTGLTLVLDQALIGMLRAPLQLLRSGVFALTRLIALLLIGRGVALVSPAGCMGREGGRCDRAPAALAALAAPGAG